MGWGGGFGEGADAFSGSSNTKEGGRSRYAVLEITSNHEYLKMVNMNISLYSALDAQF